VFILSETKSFFWPLAAFVVTEADDPQIQLRGFHMSFFYLFPVFLVNSVLLKTNKHFKQRAPTLRGHDKPLHTSLLQYRKAKAASRSDFSQAFIVKGQHEELYSMSD